MPKYNTLKFNLPDRDKDFILQNGEFPKMDILSVSVNTFTGKCFVTYCNHPSTLLLLNRIMLQTDYFMGIFDADVQHELFKYYLDGGIDDRR